MPMLPKEMRNNVAGSSRSGSPSPPQSSRFPSAKKLQHLHQEEQRARSRSAAHSGAVQDALRPGSDQKARQAAPGGPYTLPPGASVRNSSADNEAAIRGRSTTDVVHGMPGQAEWSLEGRVSGNGSLCDLDSVSSGSSSDSPTPAAQESAAGGLVSHGAQDRSRQFGIFRTWSD
jgi:hypothetical protein